VQPDSLVGLLGDLDQAAALGLRDPAWLRRHVKLVWERLIFSRILLRHARRAAAARPRPSPRRAGLEQRLRRVRRLLETDYQRPLDLAEMAAQACVSRYHFLREFRKAFGQTPYQQLIEIRLRAARRLLRSGDLPVQEVSRRVGFSSTDGFYRAFRRRYDRSPSSFRMLT
jgi:AraC-like DNA-binding protein